MNLPRITLFPVQRTLLLLAAAVACGPLLAASHSEKQAQYQREMAACKAGKTGQEMSACIKEAGAALGESRKGELAEKSGTDRGANATRRCDALPGDQRSACLARMNGQGTTTGSVSSGGVIRELTTRETVPASAAAGASAPASGPSRP